MKVLYSFSGEFKSVQDRVWWRVLASLWTKSLVGDFEVYSTSSSVLVFPRRWLDVETMLKLRTETPWRCRSLRFYMFVSQCQNLKDKSLQSHPWQEKWAFLLPLWIARNDASVVGHGQAKGNACRRLAGPSGIACHCLGAWEGWGNADICQISLVDLKSTKLQRGEHICVVPMLCSALRYTSSTASKLMWNDVRLPSLI